MATSKVKLYYFDFRGRGELIRLVLAAGGKEFEDVRIPNPFQTDLRSWFRGFKLKAPFGQAPWVEMDGKMYAQSLAIATFFAKEFGFYGRTNLERLVIDQVLQLIADLMLLGRECFLVTDTFEKDNMILSCRQKESPRCLGYLEHLLEESGTGSFVGTELSLADLAVFDLTTGFLAPLLPPLYPYPLLRALVDRVRTDHRVKGYVDTRPERPY
ncbi:probable glutathione S-transferase 7 [Aplysia californica]|uniref:Probable glutathione S-transferase 7 n=1 Tax=Aplysia californica TaxID=6500 RepID=A0ABM1A1Q4_APLCA|nr:probable glutathione S-transferase 7 [Aplysia californica]